MKICIRNATLVSMDSYREKIEYNMDILIKDNTIYVIIKIVKFSLRK